MQKIEFKLNEDKELIKAIVDELPFLSRHDIEKILDNKDVKVNNIRQKTNINLKKMVNLHLFVLIKME